MSLSSSMRNRHQTDGDYRTSATEEDTWAGSVLPSLFCIDYWSARPMQRRNLNQRRESAGALGDTKSATRFEGAPRGHGMQRRDCAFDGSQRVVAPGLEIRHGLQKAACIRMRWSIKYFVLGSQFDHAS